MNIVIVNFPGSSDAQCLANTLIELGHNIQHLDHRVEQIKGVDLVILPGGYSFGDYLRPGALTRGTNTIGAIKRFVADGGKVLGIGNGFQILCEAGLLPGILFQNPDQRFFKQDVFVKILNNETFITSGFEVGEVVRLPLACYFGRYYTDKRTINDLQDANKLAFVYCDEFGEVVDEVHDNGSNPLECLRSVAGIISRHGNVVGLMPRIDRAVSEFFDNVEGLRFFNSL